MIEQVARKCVRRAPGCACPLPAARALGHAFSPSRLLLQMAGV
jgi:hypothetical protein